MAYQKLSVASLLLLLGSVGPALGAVALPRLNGEHGAQSRLSGPPDVEADAVAAPGKGRARITEQNDTVCDAGTRQWTGTVPLGAGRDMFFWYYESRSSPESDPLLLWLNGGPGGSSMLGGLVEVGPCTVNDDAESTRRNPSSWANAVNLLVIDQPIGVGFSYTEDPKLWAENLQDAGIDLDKFLDGFFDAFPHLDDGRPVHFAGESFGGRYVPHYADMVRRRFDSVILVDPYVDPALTSLGLYEHMCRPTPPSGAPRFLNETVCRAMAGGYSACETRGELCRLTYDVDICEDAMDVCTERLDGLWEIKDGDPDPYDDRRRCKLQPEPPVCGGMGMDIVPGYLNRPRVKAALGMEHINFRIYNARLNIRWSSQPDTTVPSSREIAHLLDVKGTRVLVLNGNNDVVVSTEATLKVFDKLKWAGHADYLRQSLQPWLYPGAEGAVRGGDTKSQGRLTLVTVDDAGHQSPEHQKEATLHVLRRWIRHEPLV